MPKELLGLITKILETSDCTPEEKAELQKELSSHFLDAMRELELQGKSESEMIKIIKQEFGDPELLGQQFFMVHKRFEKIPWIGPLLYYVPAKMGIRLLLTHLVLYSASVFTLFLVTGYDDVGLNLFPFLQKIVFTCFILLSIAQGVLISRHIGKWRPFLESVITSFIPFIAILIVILMLTGLADLDSDFSYLTRFLSWPIGMQLIGITAGWAVATFLHTKFKKHENQ